MKALTKLLFKVLSIVLTILLLVQVLPLSTFAEEAAENTVPTEDDAGQPVVGGLNQIGQDAAEEPTVLGELEDLRDERVKRFRLSDGTVAAARYAMPVHTMVGGRWQTLDNTLSLVTDETDAAVYTTALRSVVYPQKLGGNSETAIEAKAGEYAVALRPDMPGKKAASAKVIDTKSTSDDPYAVHNLLNHVEYAFSNTLTLAYDYSPACLKESIILDKKPDSAVFSFTMNFGGLVPVLETDGSVTLYTDSTKTVAQAVLLAPFMEDAEGALSREIQVTLEKADGDYRYTLIASDAWLNASGRAYPVVIDPTLWLDIDRTDLVDCYVDNSQPSTPFPYDYYLYAGMNSYGTTRTYMKVANLPALPVGSVICDAQYYLWQKDADLGAGTQTNYITAHEVTSSWSYTTLTWNNQPNWNGKVIDYCAITTGSLNEYRFDITRLAKSWYEGGANYGIMLKTRDESLTKRARFYSTSTSVTDAFPHILVTYRSNKGLESYWSTTDFSAGSAGTAHVHDYSGALTFELPLAASSGEIAPVSLVGYFNSYEANVKYPGNTGTGNDVNNIKTSIGRGFRLNIQQTVIASAKYGLTGDAAAKYPYVYTDGDGTEHYIVKHTEGSTTTYVDEDGLGLTLTLGSGNTSYVLKDDKNNRLQFNAQGNLCKTIDSNGNAVTINFLPANTANGILAGQRISSVTDGSGHTFAFTYHHNADGTESGYVTKITVAGAETQLSFSGGLLLNVNYANGMTTVLRYDDAQLSEVQDTNQYLLHFFYTTGTPWPQISLVKGKQYGDTYYSKATGFDRTGYNVLVVRTVGKNSTYNDADDILTTYQFDNYGKAVTVQARTAGGTNYGAAVCNYTPNSTSNVSGCRTSNRVAASASLGKNVVNLLRNGNAESTTNWSNYLRDGVTASLGTAHYMGQKSLQFTCSQATTSSLGYWYQDYTGMAVGSTYTFSAYVKTANMSPVSTKGAYVAVKAWGGTEEPTYSSHFLTDNGNTGINNGWRRLTASITVPEGTTKLRVYAGFAACNGTVNFDCLQLENASVAGSFNLLENPSFERYNGTVPESWTAYNHTACVVTSQHKEGTASVQTTGNPAQVHTYYQYIPVDGNRDETYIISGWAKANAILPDAHSSAVPRFNISIRVTYRDSSGATCTEDKTPASFNPTVTGWQYTAQAFTLAHSGTSSASYTPTQIMIILRYDYECNTAWFDFLQLTRDVASSYVYNADGKLTTVKANAEQQSGLTYSNTTKDLTAFTDALGYTTNYTYDSAHNLTFTKSPNNVYTALQYNTNGNVNGRQIQKNSAGTEIVAREGIAYTEATGTTPAYAYVRWFTTEDGGKTTYDYNTQTGFLNSSTASNGTVTAYTPQHATNDTRVKKVTTDGTSVNYAYTGSRLTGLTYGAGSTATDSYVFTYNKFGDPVSTKVGGVTLSTNAYVANRGLLEYTTYGNGTKLGYVYDYLGRMTGVKNRTGTADNYLYTWAYAPDDTVRQHRDGVNVKKYRYDYDSIGRLIRYDVFNNSTDAYIGSSQFGYDKRNNLTSITFAMDGKSCLQRYFYSPISGLSNTTGYAADNLPTRYQISSASHVDYSYDVIERLTQKSLTTGSASLYTDYAYKQSARGGNYTTHLIETELLANDGYQYTYNLMGNVTAVKKGTRANMSTLSNYRAYTYDAKGELTGETIYSGGSSTQRTYAYDGLGNLTSQTQTGVLGNKTISYTYGTSSNAGWGKMLNSVSITQNGNTTTENIVYDQIGNPTTYRNASLTWFGRQLTAYSKSGTSASFTYDADGLRGKKTVNGTTSTYQYVNGHLAYEKRGNVQYFYFYDSFGKLSSIRFYDPAVNNGSAQNYFTLTNQQGDVVAIYNVAGTKVASYEYDAWGSILATTDTSGVNIATRNPFRYRGYYYDQETGLYYLQSRYYDPEIGRFINADSQLNGTSVLGFNPFAYCENNPVNSVDSNGHIMVMMYDGGGLNCFNKAKQIKRGIEENNTLLFKKISHDSLMVSYHNPFTVQSFGINWRATVNYQTYGYTSGLMMDPDGNFAFFRSKTIEGVGTNCAGIGLFAGYSTAKSISELEGQAHQRGVEGGAQGINLTVSSDGVYKNISVAYGLYSPIPDAFDEYTVTIVYDDFNSYLADSPSNWRYTL